MANVEAEGDLGQDILSDIMEMTAKDELPDSLYKSMMHQLIHSEMWKEADTLEAKWLELQRSDSALMMQCPHCQKKIDFGFTCCTWCMHSLGAFAHHDKAGGDSSLAQDVAGVRATSGNKHDDARFAAQIQ